MYLYQNVSRLIKTVQHLSKCHNRAKSFPGQGRNNIGEMWAGRATQMGILLLRLNNKGTAESRKTRLTNSACANPRRLVEGAEQSERETRESSRFPSFRYQGDDVTRMLTLMRTHTHGHSRKTFGRTGSLRNPLVKKEKKIEKMEELIHLSPNIIQLLLSCP